MQTLRIPELLRGAKNTDEKSNTLSRVQQRYKQTDDGRLMP